MLTGILSGCQGGGGNDQCISPPMPVQSHYRVVTDSYLLRYPGASYPFPRSWQFADTDYPIPVASITQATPPEGFNLTREIEDAVQCWHHADPRICITNNAPADQARISVQIVREISVAGQGDMIGLTTVTQKTPPHFVVQVATRYNTNSAAGVSPSYRELDASAMRKILAHELGHVFGLGHSPTASDLMFAKDNGEQGQSYTDFLTYGDAVTLWATLNVRQVNWRQLPAITTLSSTSLRDMRSGGFTSTSQQAEVVCMYVMH